MCTVTIEMQAFYGDCLNSMESLQKAGVSVWCQAIFRIKRAANEWVKMKIGSNATI